MRTRHHASLAWLAIACLVVGGCQFLRPDAPRVECDGVPADQCAEYAASWPEGATTEGEQVVGVTVTCVSDACTDAAGEVQVSVRLRSGEVRPVGGGGWSSGAADPQPAEPAGLPEGVPLACIGVPRPACEERATDAISGLVPGSGPITGITVRCLVETCTEHKGEGDTRVALGGAPAVVMNWVYESL